MLKIYDTNHNAIGHIVKYKDLKIEGDVTTGDRTLSFTYMARHHEICEEFYIETQDDEYVVKERKHRWISFICSCFESGRFGSKTMELFWCHRIHNCRCGQARSGWIWLDSRRMYSHKEKKCRYPADECAWSNPEAVHRIYVRSRL